MRILLLSILLISGTMRFSYAATGTAGGQFLKIGVAAKPSALGETSALLDGAQSIAYNPAGIGKVNNLDLSFSQVTWIKGINYSNIAAAKRKGKHVFGFGFNYLSSPAIDEYDNSGTKLSDTYSAMDMALTLGYGRKVASRTHVGTTLKYISSRLESHTASALATDAGIQHIIIKDTLDIGVAVQNMGTSMKFISTADPLPLTVKIGGKYNVPLKGSRNRGNGITMGMVRNPSSSNNSLSLFSDINYIIDTGIFGNLGAEFLMDYGGNAFALRGGYRTNNGSNGISFGIGWMMRGYSIDYAFAPLGELGQAHRISLGVRFDSKTTNARRHDR